MRKTAQHLFKYTCISILVFTIFFGSLNYVKNNQEITKDAQAATLNLGLAPSLDIDVAPDGPSYTNKSHMFRVTQGNAISTNYHYLSDTSLNIQTPNTPVIEFGRSIAQAKINGVETYLPGKDPDSSRIDANKGVIQGIDWHMGNPRLYRDAMQNAKRVYRCSPDDYPGDPDPCPTTLQYQSVPEGANQRGYFFVSSNALEDCSNVARRQNFRIATTHNRFKTLSPGTPSAPNTDDMPIHYRFGRGNVKSIFSADGNVAMIVETRVYFDNVCTFASMSADEDVENMPNQRLSNVSFPVIALVSYNRRTTTGPKWKTVNLSQKTYKTAIIPNGGAYDAIIWGASVTGTLGESITYGHPGSTKTNSKLDSSNPDQAYYRNRFPTFNNGGAGTAAFVSMIGISNIFSGNPGIAGKGFQVVTDCGGSNCSYEAAPMMSAIEPVFKADNPTNNYSDGTLYITLRNPVFDNNGAYGKSYIISLKNANDLNKPIEQLNFRQFDSKANPRGICYSYGYAQANILDPNSLHDPCINDPANALGVNPASKVPLLQRGTFLRFTGPQIFPDAAGSVSSGFIEDPANRSITNSEIQKLPIRSLNGSLMAGSYFIELGAEKNIIAVADNTTRLIWVGGENLEVDPKLKAFNDPICDPTDRINPYKMKFSVQTESKSSANIAYNFALLTPAMPSPSEFAYNTITNQVTTSSSVNYIIATTANNNSTPQYTTTIDPFTPSKEPIFSFAVNFKDQNFYKDFYSTGGFDLYLYIKDNSNPANNNLINTNKLERVFTNKVFDSFESCAYPFFATSKGDFRSKETRGTSSSKANKFWRKNTTTVTDPYVAKANSTDSKLPAASDFDFEWHKTGSEACESRIKRTQSTNNDFCLQIENAYDLSQRGTDGVVTKFLNETLAESKQKEMINVINVDASSTSPLVTPLVIGANTYHQLNLNAISDKTKPTLIEINAAKYSTPDFIISDSIDPALTPNIIIVKCNIVDCIMSLNSLGVLAGSDVISMDNTASPPRLKYGSSFADRLVKEKSRLYINYSFNTVGYDPKENYSTTTPDPDVRKMILRSPDTANLDDNNFYLGGLITSGYLYSDFSTKTNVVKGLVISRGVVARSAGPGIKNLYFKDFIYPFMHIDYDPKLMLKFRTIFTQPPSDVVREYVGL